MQKIIKTEIIENYLKENNISKYKFCKLCNVSRNIFDKIMANDTNFGIKALFKIARILNIEAHELFY